MEVRADRRHTGRKLGRETALQIRHPAIDRRSPSLISGAIFWAGFISSAVCVQARSAAAKAGTAY
jgi:hypothetical protein